MSNSSRKELFDADKMLLSDKSPFTMQEAYKTLRTNVTFSLPGSGCKCIGIVSADRSDGKSSIAVNLAISLAHINKKVILLDCDMRLPTVALKLGEKSTPGLSDYLAGSIGTLPVINVADKKIDIVPAGHIPPDSTTLIASNEMLKLINSLKETYDYIVFDFPPVTIVSDAVMLSGTIDGYLVIARHNASEYPKISMALRQLRFADAKIIGFVYNGKSEEKKYYKKGKSYRHYKYYYQSNRQG